jgi:hypothetical protein
MACVYILTNPAIPGLVKIGYTAGTAADRAAQISQGTGVPTAYQVDWYCETTTADTAAQLERDVHHHCAANRVNRAREFFQMTVAQAAAVIESIGYRTNTIAITSPEVAARAAAEQDLARAEQAQAQAAAEAEQAQARAAAKRDTETRERAQRQEQLRINQAHHQETEKAATWFFGIGALLLLSPVWVIGLILILVGWMIHPSR